MHEALPSSPRSEMTCSTCAGTSEASIASPTSSEDAGSTASATACGFAVATAARASVAAAAADAKVAPFLRHLPVWQWSDALGVFRPFVDEARLCLEAAFLRHESELPASSCIELPWEGEEGAGVLVVDVVSMKQRLLDKGGVPMGPAADVRRMEPGKVAGGTTWVSQSEDAVSIKVPPGHADGLLVAGRVLGWDAGLLDPQCYAIVDIQRVQHRTLRQRYELEREDMVRERGSECLNERLLFHGTRRHCPVAIAHDRDGFMVERGGGSSYYGRGCYFAETPAYAMHYAHWLEGEQDGVRQFLLVDVLCGVMRELGQLRDCEGRECNRAWLRDHGYDSVRGGPHCPVGRGPSQDDASMVVVYRPNQAYPRFVVSVAPIRLHRTLSLLGNIAAESAPLTAWVQAQERCRSSACSLLRRQRSATLAMPIADTTLRAGSRLASRGRRLPLQRRSLPQLAEPRRGRGASAGALIRRPPPPDHEYDDCCDNVAPALLRPPGNGVVGYALADLQENCAVATWVVAEVARSLAEPS